MQLSAYFSLCRPTKAFYFVPIHSALTATAASFAVAAAAAQWKTVVAAAAAVLGRMKARKNPQP